MFAYTLITRLHQHPKELFIEALAQPNIAVD